VNLGDAEVQDLELLDRPVIVLAAGEEQVIGLEVAVFSIRRESLPGIFQQAQPPSARAGKAPMHLITDRQPGTGLQPSCAFVCIPERPSAFELR
jgi:hypothetical protein